MDVEQLFEQDLNAQHYGHCGTCNAVVYIGTGRVTFTYQTGAQITCDRCIAIQAAALLLGGQK